MLIVQNAKKIKKILLSYFILALTVVPSISEANATVQHDYYVPYFQGMDNVYGAYRVISARGEQSISVLGVRKTAIPGKHSDSSLDALIPDSEIDNIFSYVDSRTIKRDDIFIFTELPAAPDASFTETITEGESAYQVTHNYYYEYPVAIAGYSLDMSPVHGSAAVDQIGSPWTIAMDQAILKNYMPDFTSKDLVPNYNGTNPRGYVVKSASASGVQGVTGPHMRHGGKYNASRSSSSSSSANTNTGSSNRYIHIVSLEPSEDLNVDFVGWWDIFSQQILSRVESLREDLDSISDTSQRSLGDGISSFFSSIVSYFTGTDKTMYDMLESTDSIGIYFEPNDFDDYKFDSALTYSGSPSNVFRMNAYLGFEATYNLWLNKAAAIKTSIEESSFSGMPVVSGLALSSFSTATPGYWTLPRADLLDNASVYIYSLDPDMLGIYPFARAIADLYDSGKYPSPTIADAGSSEPDPYSALSSFLGKTITSGTNFGDAFTNKIKAAPFNGHLAYTSTDSVSSARAGWNEPWLPTAASDDSIWAYWYQNDPQLYMQIVPSMSVRMGTTLSDISGVTAWNKGVENRRLQKGLMQDVADINTTTDFSVSTQRDLKSRNIADETTYTTFSGTTATNTIDYVTQFKAESGYDFGRTLLSGNDATSFTSNVNVKYFPVYVGKMSTIKTSFPFLGTLIADPNYTNHQTLWSLFPLDSESAAGLNLTPPTWDMLVD